MEPLFYYYFKYIAYGLLFLAAVAFATLALLKRTRRAWLAYGVPSLVISISLITAYYNIASEAKKMDMANVGTYYLSQYPNCADCKLILTEDHRFKVVSHNKTVKRGTWEFVSDPDNDIVYLDDVNLLGFEQYAYDRREIKYPYK